MQIVGAHLTMHLIMDHKDDIPSRLVRERGIGLQAVLRSKQWRPVSFGDNAKFVFYNEYTSGLDI
jgi:hypothetical protein